MRATVVLDDKRIMSGRTKPGAGPGFALDLFGRGESI
jgi:hypothetical protein